MTPKAMAALFFAWIALQIVVYDLWVLNKYGREGTLTWVVRRAGEAWPPLPPLVAAGLGVLYGHFFPLMRRLFGWQPGGVPESCFRCRQAENRIQLAAASKPEGA